MYVVSAVRCLWCINLIINVLKTFEELGVSAEIRQAIEEMGYENPMPVQEEVIPYLLGVNNDVVALAQTGTGKTAAYGLPVLQKVDATRNVTQALILSPTRELCLQIADDLENYSKYLPGVRVLPVYGGANIEPQIRTLRKGVQVIVATPGRLIDLMERGAASLEHVENVVLDEADEMLSMGFTESIDKILAGVPENHNTLLFSATMSREIERISKKYLREAKEIVVGSRNEGAETVNHVYYMVHAKDKYLALKRIVDYYPKIYAIIFCRTRMETQEVADKLIQDGYNADSLHGDLSQQQRDLTMQKFRQHRVQFLVATDVAARGLDVEDLTHVINYGMPDDIENYTHRSGRTGRAGKKGTSICIVHTRERSKIREIEKVIGKEFVKGEMPSGKEICAKQLYKVIDDIERVEVDEEEIEQFPIGMLVDNSIVVIENIYRLRSEGYSIKKAAVEGAGGVTGAIIASTLTTVCVFVPIVFTEGITRQLFVDIALTITFTLTASLIVALTFVPMMAAGLLKNPKEVRHAFFEKVQQGYAKLLELALRFKPVVFIGVTVLLVTSALAAYSRGFSFMDMNMETDQLTVTVAAKEDEKLTFEELCERADEVTEKIAGIDGVETIGAIAGGDGALMSMGGSSDSVTMYLLLDENSSVTAGEITAQIAELTKDMDCQVDTDNSASDMSSFLGSGITVQIKGSDLGTLQGLAGKVAGVVEAQEGTVDVDDGLDNTTQSYTIHVDKEKAAEYGMTTAQVFQLVYAKLASQTAVTAISAGVQDYEVYVRSEEQANVTLDDIKNLTFSYEDKMAQLSSTGSNGEKETDEKLSEDTKDTGDAKDIEDTEDTGDTGDTVKEIPLTEIATFEAGSSLNAVSRDSQTRYISVTAGVDDTHNVTLVANALMKELNKIDLPEGYSIEMTGEDEMIADAMQQLYLMLILAVVFIYLIMVAQFQSFLSPFIIMFTIPLAFTGGLFALFFTGNEISVVAMIGFVMLAGIIVNNGIVMVDYINQLRRGGMTKKEALLNSAKTRLRPILMTALTTILSMSTMALGLGDGSEMMQPMAIVTEGGLIYGTLLTLFVVPCIYDAFNREKNMVEEEL